MSNIFNITDGTTFFSSAETGEALKGGGGGGTFDDMETRVKLLEFRAEQTEKLLAKMDSKLDGLVKDVSEIKGKVANAPTVWTIWQTNAALLATVVAVAIGTVALLKNFGIL